MLLIVFRPRFGVHKNGATGSFVSLKNVSLAKISLNKGEGVTSRRRSGFRNVLILILSMGVALIFLEMGWGRVSMRRLSSTGKTAVLEATPAYRVPDIRGAVNARFGEGQPVIVGTYHLEWYYAESPDGRSGWVPREAVINY